MYKRQLIELVFSLNEEQKKRIEELEFPIEDDTLILQRKLMQGRSICRVNGESVSMGQLRQLSGVLLDMCGQHEHQQLLGKEKPAQLLDAFAGKKLAELKDNLKNSYREYRQLQKELSENALDEQTRKREMDLLSFEVKDVYKRQGYSIPAISQKVQDKVKSTIESMTGLNVTDVNIRVAGVGM